MPQYGDTLSLNRTNYTNVVKTKGLPAQSKEIGKKVRIEFKIITSNKIETIGCNITNYATYNLKEIFNQHWRNPLN
jgi:fructose-1-phosphate kinase PfkB-like protein